MEGSANNETLVAEIECGYVATMEAVPEGAVAVGSPVDGHIVWARWNGPINGLVSITNEFLEAVGVDIFPWPMERLGDHPSVPRASLWRRTDA